MTAETQAAAILAALNAVLTPKHAYDLDDVRAMTTKPAEYVEVTLSATFGGNGRVSGQPMTPSYWRLTTRAVATSVGNARLLLSKCDQALSGVVVTVGADATTPIRFETETSIEPDDTKTWSGLRSWTYAI